MHILTASNCARFLAGACLTTMATSLAAQDASGSSPPGDEIIVTGTRSANTRALDSASPIQIVSSAALQRASQTNLSDSLVTVSPSVTKRNNGTDVGALTNAIRLRGLNPNHVLVLLNGRRRHNTANIYAPSGPDQGSTPVDLDMIPTNLVDHIEVLQDGAAAQYGSDAIAGVINIILKSDEGGHIHALTGAYGEGDGWTGNLGADWGTKLGSDGFIHVAADVTRSNRTDRGDPDTRTGGHDNKIWGDPAITRENVGVNLGKPLSDGVDFYANATYGHRHADALENYRLPTVLPAVYPNGFSPREISDENDYALTIGLKGDDVLGFQWDLNSSWGQDYLDVSMRDTINLDLYNDTGSSPTSLNVQHFTSSQWTTDLDLSRDIPLAFLARPLHLAFGGEYRRDFYKIEAGDPDSYYGSGTQALVGISPANAGNYSRNVYAGWIDVAAHITPKWDIDLAGRYENYSDAGDTKTGKISTRYEITRGLALRGTVSNGFRAPTLAETHFSNLFVSPTGASGQLAVSSVAARILGSKPLKPETSRSYSAGIVLQPARSLAMTVDFYQIDIKNRIIGGGSYNGATAIDALAAQGIALPSGLDPNNVTATYFANGANTRTRGMDLTVNYKSDLGNWGSIDWLAMVSLNKTTLRSLKDDANGNPLLNAQGVSYLTHVAPRSKIILGAHWTHEKLDFNLRETRWGKVSQPQSYTVGPNAYSLTQFVPFTAQTKWLTDIELGYQATRSIRIAIGANNLFDTRPTKQPFEARYLGVILFPQTIQQIGANGGFYYAKADVRF
jgi:iron complex outermembrane recepter protein